MGEDQARAILYVHADAGLYGSGVSLLELSSRLPQDRYRPLVALPEGGPLEKALRQRGVEVFVLPLGALRRTFRPDHIAGIMWHSLSAARRLARLVQEHRVLAVHTNNSHVLSGAVAARIARVPHIIHVRENILPPRVVSQGLSRLLFSLSDRVVVVSHGAAAEFLGQRASHAKVRVIYNGVDLSAFRTDLSPARARAELGWEVEPLHVGVIARLAPWKGHEVFLRAAALIADSSPRARFVVVGDADTARNQAHKRHLQDLSARLGLSRRVRWVGFVSPVQPFIAALDVVVVPSVRPEPFGRSLIEAMAMERPVVATDHGGPPEILSGGGGLLVPPGDHEAMASAVAGLLADREKRLSLSAVAREQARRRFNIDSHVQAVTDLYDELLGSSRGRGA